MYKSLIALCLTVASTHLYAFELVGVSIHDDFKDVLTTARYTNDGKNRLYLSEENILIKIKGTEQNKVKQVKLSQAIFDKDFYTVLSEYKKHYPLEACLQESKMALKAIREKGYGKVICSLQDDDSKLKLNIATYAGQVTVKAHIEAP